MFSRAAKSVVKSLGSRRIHTGEKNFKIALIGGVGEISQTLSRLLQDNTKLIALYDAVVVNRPLSNYNEQSFEPVPSGIIMAKKSCSDEGSRSNAAISARRTDNDNEENNGRSQIEKLMEALYRLPIAEEAPAFNGPLIPIEELMPKAGNACGRMHPYAGVLHERDSSIVKTWRRSYVTVAIRKCFSDSTYSTSFQKHRRNVAPDVKIAKKRQSIEKTRKIGRASCTALAAKENNRQSSPTSLLNHDEEPARRLMKKFGNVGVLRNIEARWRAVEKLADWIIPEALLNNKLLLSRKIYSRIKFPSVNFVNQKRENNREVVPFNRDHETLTDDTLNVVGQENWIRRTCCKIESVLPNLHAKIRLHSTTASDSYCSENIFAVSQVARFSDIISSGAILFASKGGKDDRRKIGIRKKIQEFCMQRKKSLKKEKTKGKNESSKISEKCEKILKRKGLTKEACEKGNGKEIDCIEGRKPTNKKQNVVSCKGKKNNKRNSIHECRKNRERKVEVQEDPCKRKEDISKIEEDPCKQRPVKQKQTSHKPRDTDPCKLDKKEEKEIKLHDPDPCRVDKKEEIEIKLHDPDPCRVDKKEKIEIKLHNPDPCRLDKKEDIKKKEKIKKEEIKKPDSEIKKVDPCEKKTCPTVKKAPKCEDN